MGNIERLLEDVRSFNDEVQRLIQSPQEDTARDLSRQQRTLHDRAIRLVHRKPIVFLALLDVSLNGIVVNSMLRDWEETAVAGLGLIPARLGLEVNAQGSREELEIELERLIGVKFDELVTSCAKAKMPAMAALYCDIFLNMSHRSRQIVTFGGAEVANSWVRMNAAVQSFSANSETSLPFENAATSTASDIFKISKHGLKSWRLMRHHRKSSQLDTTVSRQDADKKRWEALVSKISTFEDRPLFEKIYSTTVTLSETALAAQLANRDIIYISAGSRGGAAIRYFGGDDFVRQPETVELPEATLNKVKRWQRSLWTVGAEHAEASDGVATLRKYLEVIGGSLLRPVLDAWPDLRRVTIIPIGSTQGLPFSAAQVNGKCFGDLVDLTVSPSISCLLSALMPSESSHCDAAVFGDSSQGSDFLPLVHEEVDRISAIYRVEPSLKVGDDCADGSYARSIVRRNLKESPVGEANQAVLNALSAARVLHFACHGFVSSTGGPPEMQVGGTLRLDDLLVHRLSAGSTVVLSACSVGLSNVDAPLANYGFPALFLSTGASNVIASSWELPDTPELINFMCKLHCRIHEGLSARLALNEAMQWASANNVSPLVWAGFNCYGI